MNGKKLEKVIGCRVTGQEEQDFGRIAGYLETTSSELLRWFVQRAIKAEQVIMEEVREKGIILPPEAFLARMNGQFSNWFREAFLVTNWIQRPEEIEGVGLKLLDLAQRFRMASGKSGDTQQKGGDE